MKNVLVQYQGGGYEGCFWEWNYFFLDKEGSFHDIFSSGRGGIETAERAKELLASDDTFYTYDMTDDKAIEDFSRECNVVNVTGVLQWFDDNPQDGIEFFVLCSECGERQTDMSELSLEEWHGCGGTQNTADKLLCPECISAGTCDCCNEYIGESEMVALYQVESESDLARRNEFVLPTVRELIDDGFDCVCSYCLDDRIEQREQSGEDDILWESLTTGKPDMFSDDMRWFWGAV